MCIPLMSKRIVMLIVLAVGLSACGAPHPTPTLTPTLTPEPIIPTFTPEPGEPLAPDTGRRTLNLWLVEPLARGGQIPVALLEQLQVFRAEHADLDIDVRVKLAEGVDGILPVLRSTASVAPGAMPDLLLLSRPDLVSAWNDSLIQSLTALPEETTSGMFAVAEAMVTFEDGVYGIPYLLDTQHLIYRETAFEQAPTTFEDMLDAPAPYLFPAGSGLTVLGQYLAEGSPLIDGAGAAALNMDALLVVLNFYAAGVEAQMIQSALLEYTDSEDYFGDFLNGQASLVNVNVTTYLQHRRELPDDTAVAPIPARRGPSVPVITGWSWAMVTADPDRQELVLELLTWLMRPENLAAFSREVGMLPAQRPALQIWGNDPYNSFAEALLGGAEAVPAPAGVEELTAARVLQEAMRSMLLEMQTPVQAAEDAIEAIADGE